MPKIAKTRSREHRLGNEPLRWAACALPLCRVETSMARSTQAARACRSRSWTTRRSLASEVAQAPRRACRHRSSGEACSPSRRALWRKLWPRPSSRCQRRVARWCCTRASRAATSLLRARDRARVCRAPGSKASWKLCVSAREQTRPLRERFKWRALSRPRRAWRGTSCCSTRGGTQPPEPLAR